MNVITPSAIPDYSEQVAAELRVSAKRWRDSAKHLIDAFDENEPLQALLLETEPLSNTAHLLGYSSIRFGLIEVVELLKYWQNRAPVDKDEAALVLLQIAEELQASVALPPLQARRMSALSWLSVIDNCRACRQVTAMSKDVVAAAGIALPTKSTKPMPARSDGEDFLAAIRAVHKSFARQLIAWYRQPIRTGHLTGCGNTFIRLANACDNPSRLSMLEPLFRAAGVVLENIVEDPSQSSLAVQRVLGRFERYLAKLGSADLDALARLPNLLPDDILRQLLFYVARFPSSSKDAERLRRNYGLHVLATTTQQVNEKRPVNSLLHEQVLAQIDVELNELKAWLSQAAADPSHPRAKWLFARLDEQIIAVTLLGFDDLQSGLIELRVKLRGLATPATQTQQLQVAEQLLRVRETLHSPALDKPTEASGLPASAVDSVAARLRLLSRHNDKDKFQAMAAVACLQVVQSELRRAESDVLALMAGSPEFNASAEDLSERFNRAAQAVTVLPLPEAVPLLKGLADNVQMVAAAEASNHERANFAELLVALDLYLDSIVTNSRSLTPLLQHAVQALQALSEHGAANEMGAHADSHESSQGDALIDEDIAPAHSVLDNYLAVNQKITPWVNGQSEDSQSVQIALTDLRDAAGEAELHDMAGLVNDCAHYIKQTPLPDDARDLVHETLAVVPQMLHAEPSVAESVRGLDKLQQRLRLTGIVADSGTQPEEQVGQVASEVFELNDDSLDNTLQNVFARECATHINTLRNAITVARADIPLAKLPSEEMLRALHTLSGCAQTVDATDIVSIVQPLQKTALTLQRSAKDYTDAETDFIERLTDAMDARLQSFQHQEPVDQSILAIESELPDFVEVILARSKPLSGDSEGDRPVPNKVSSWLIAKSNRVEPSEAGLSSIFRAEADDLMLRLRTHTSVLLQADSKAESKPSNEELAAARDGALKVLHTIKGSARMAGNHAMADAAHDLESDVTRLNESVEFGETIRQRLPHLQATIDPATNFSVDEDTDAAELEASTDETLAIEYDTTSVVPFAPFDNDSRVNHSNDPSMDQQPKGTDTTLSQPATHSASETLPVAEATLDALLNTGSTLVSRQASVDDRIKQLRDHIRDIQASADRLQRLASNNPAFDSVASRELVADIQVARRQLERSVQELQHVHGLASHAGTAVHRALVQARLQTVDSLLPRLEATLSDALTVCNREANLLLTGGEIPVSATTLKSLAPLLEQLIRNAVAHGIDTPSVRQSDQKPGDGEIAIVVQTDGTDLLIDVSDDGDGVDEDALNQLRQEQNLPPIRHAKHLREILCSPGYSTLTDATPVAGRGQGLALVLDGVEALGGGLELINDPGEGLTVRIRIPQQMVIAQCLVFGQGNALHAIPVNFITSIVDCAESATTLQYQEQEWTVFTVEQLMGVAAINEPADRCALVTMGGECIAIPVPGLDGYKELIVQPLGVQLQSLERYVGGAVLSDGRQALILNLHRLAQLRIAAQRSVIASSSGSLRSDPPVALIADDSVTMRVAGERLLQRLGFQVHSARDGLEALDFLTRSMPSVLLLDIEMPGADGFDVVRRVRANLVAAEVPVIMISTRRGPQERERARSLGIRHLIHKPYTETQLREALEEVGVLTSAEIGN